jgi:hypothetical protein
MRKQWVRSIKSFITITRYLLSGSLQSLFKLPDNSVHTYFPRSPASSIRLNHQVTQTSPNVILNKYSWMVLPLNTTPTKIKLDIS